MKHTDITQWHRVHIVGIGGIGMSAIAWLLHQRGVMITGSDLQPNRHTETLSKAGIAITYGHDPETGRHADGLIISAAIHPDNPEYIGAMTRCQPLLKRGEALALLMRPYRHRIVVAGTHGKTTTTSLSIQAVLSLNPSYALGALFMAHDSNARHANPDYFIAESDESDGSFLLLDPTIAIITTLDHEHIDYYPTLAAIRAAFTHFITTTLSNPAHTLILNYDDPELRDLYYTVLRPYHHQIIIYSTTNTTDNSTIINTHSNTQPLATVYAKQASYTPDGSAYIGCINSAESSQLAFPVELPLIGLHNISNSLAAVALSYKLGQLPPNANTTGFSFSDFQGASRRSHLISATNRNRIIDDYAHHPTEITALLRSLKAVQLSGRLIAIIQPHRISRVGALLAAFATCFRDADYVIITPIYTANESDSQFGTASDVMHALKNRIQHAQMTGDLSDKLTVTYADNLQTIAPDLGSELQAGDWVVTLGAGTVSQVAYDLAAYCRAHPPQ